MGCGHRDVAGGIFGDVMACVEKSCGGFLLEDQGARYCRQEYLLLKQVETAENAEAEELEPKHVEALPNLDSMDACDGQVVVDDCVAKDQSGVHGEGLGQDDSEPLLSGAHPGTVLPRPRHSGFDEISGLLCKDGDIQARSEETVIAPVPCDREVAALQVPNDRGQSDHLTTTTAPIADAKAEEAAALRAVGVTGDEGFKPLFRKLRALKWKWGPAVGPLSSDTWILKGGFSAKTARAGLEKFETPADVVLYVQEVLGLQDAAMSDGQEEESERNLWQSPRKIIEQGELDGGTVARQAGISSPDETVEEEAEEASQLERGEPLTSEGQALQTALEALNPSNAPDVLKQRATEFRDVLQFITNSVTEPSGGSMYLCGCPGTGKTQTMFNVQAKIKHMASKVITTPRFF